MHDLEPLEVAVLENLLDGNHPVLQALRKQMPLLSVKRRERTGAGFFTEFELPESAPAASLPSGKVRFGDVEATILGLQHGAGFLLYVDDGLIAMLEGYSYEEPWPDHIDEFALRYSNPNRETVLNKLG